MGNRKEILNNDYEEITKMLLKSYVIADMAKELNYSPSTISNRLNSLFKKFNVKNRSEYIIMFFASVVKDLKTQLKNEKQKYFNLKRMYNEMIYFLDSFNNKLKNKNLALLINKAKNII